MKSALWRRRRAVVATAAALVASTLTACSAPAGAASCEGVSVDVGIVNSASDALVYIGMDKGYFADEGLELKLHSFKSAGEMTPYLGTGHLDVGAGAPSAGFYNGIARGIDIKLVADKGQLRRGYNYMPLLVRKDLVESGQVKSVKDLKGLSVAEPAPAVATASTLSEILKTGGLEYDDVKHEYLGFGNHEAAFKSGAIDAALTTDPAATSILSAGTAVKFADSTKMYNNQQLSVLLYAGEFADEESAAAQCFMNGYVRAARDYNAATEGGDWDGDAGEEMVDIIHDHIGMPSALLKETTPNYTDPGAELNVSSLQQDYDFFVEQGFYTGKQPIDFGSLVDTKFTDAVPETTENGQ